VDLGWKLNLFVSLTITRYYSHLKSLVRQLLTYTCSWTWILSWPS
jgi:hypothetical protein